MWLLQRGRSIRPAGTRSTTLVDISPVYRFSTGSHVSDRFSPSTESHVISTISQQQSNTRRGRGQAQGLRRGGRAGATSDGRPRVGRVPSRSQQRHGGRDGGGGFRGGPLGGTAAVFAAGQPLAQDARLTDRELNQLVRSFSRLSVQQEMPLRPGWGTYGELGLVRTNFFTVTLPKGATYYEYEVSMNPESEAKGKRRFRIMELVEKSPQLAPYVTQVAHDRSQRLISVHKLPQPLDIPICYLEEGQANDPNARTFTVEVKFLSELKMSTLNQYMNGKPEHRDINTQPIISALNIILQQHAQRNGVRVAGNEYFFPSSAEHHRLSFGVEAFCGFFMSVRPMFKQLTVNVNVCTAAFYKPGNLAKAMDAFLQETGRAMPHAFSKGLKISTEHLGFTRNYTIQQIVRDKTARTERFDCEEFGGKVSVEKFFQRKHGIKLRRHSDLPLVNVSANPERPIYLPAEICEIFPGQAYRGELDDKQMAKMSEVSCNGPAFNGDAIVNQGFSDLGLRPDAVRPALAAFGITVNPDMQVVPCRVLPAPSIYYHDQGRKPLDARWNNAGMVLWKGGNMTNWAVLLVNEGRSNEFQGADDPKLKTFLEAFRAQCRASGIKGAHGPSRIMSINLPSPRDDTPTRSRAIAAISNVLKGNLKAKEKPSFVLVLLSEEDRQIYAGIKQLADVELGVHTVHMLLTTARDDSRANRQERYFSNVALKVNAKLGGVNHQLDKASMGWLTVKPTMVMGIDVTHPWSSSTPGSPSIAAVVASVDDCFMQFPASLTLQRPNPNKDSKEIVEYLTQMTVERLELYQKKNNGKLPERIFVFRDGVSESQYIQILQFELPKLKAAFQKFKTSSGTPYEPTVSIIVCGKRHHARFWSTDLKHMTKNGNILPGTVVDKGITDIYNFDFYLQAHSEPQGQAKATHYVVIYDENKLDADTIQQGTHTASYLYARATNAVSLVPAAYYADIACERGREYLNVLLNPKDDRASAQRSQLSVEEKERLKQETYKKAEKMWGKGVHEELRDSMFYI